VEQQGYNMKKLLLSLTIIGSLQAFALNGFAQDSDDSSAPEESMYKNEADVLMENKTPSQNKKNIYSNDNGNTPSEEMKSVSDLDRLTPFSDIAVIQKRFLPKSQRFEFNPNVGLVTNNAFFMTTYLQARLAYAFTEKLAMEFSFAMFMDQKYKVTQDLKDDAQVDTKSLLLPDSYYGADLRWSPIYGKMGMFSDGIVPFDMYFSAGGGIMTTNQDTTPFAMHAGTGQIFAINKWMAFRWDLSMYFYTSQVKSADVNSTAKTDQSFTDVQLSLGMSFFFPDATYR
jgi:outer membrane beta-barrel protein